MKVLGTKTPVAVLKIASGVETAATTTGAVITVDALVKGRMAEAALAAAITLTGGAFTAMTERAIGLIERR